MSKSVQKKTSRRERDRDRFESVRLNISDEGNLTEKSACGFNLRYFQTETHVYIFTKNRTVRRGSPTRKPMDRWTDARGLPTVRCADMGTTTRSGGGARAPSASTEPSATAQATPHPQSRYQRHPCSMTMAGSLHSMPFAFFAAISRPRGVMDASAAFSRRKTTGRRSQTTPRT